MNDSIDIFKVFDQYKEVAPKNMKEVEQLEVACRQHGKVTLADYLYEWRMSVDYNVYREFDEAEYAIDENP